MSAASIHLRKARGVAGVLNVAFAVLRANAKMLGKSLLYFAAPFLVLASGAFSAGFLDYVLAVSTSIEPVPELPGSKFWVGLAAAVLFGVAGSVFATASVFVVFRLYDERGAGQFDVGDVWSGVLSHLGGLLLLHIIFTIAIVLSAIVLVIPFLGLLLWMGAIGVLSARYLFVAPAVLILEQTSTGTAIGRAGRLTKNKFWHTFGVVVVAFLTQSILSGIFTLPMQVGMIVAAELGMNGGDGLPSVIFFSLFLLSSVGTLLTTVIVYLASGAQYFNLREQKEYASLERRVAELEADVEAAAPPSETPDGASDESEAETEDVPAPSADPEEASGDGVAEEADRWRG